MITFAKGSIVNSGELLYQLDARPYQAGLHTARPELAKATAALQRAQEGVDLARIELDQITTVVRQYKALGGGEQQSRSGCSSTRLITKHYYINLAQISIWS